MTRTCIQTTLDIRFMDESIGTYDELEKALLAHFGTSIESASAVDSFFSKWEQPARLSLAVCY